MLYIIAEGEREAGEKRYNGRRGEALRALGKGRRFRREKQCTEGGEGRVMAGRGNTEDNNMLITVRNERQRAIKENGKMPRYAGRKEGSTALK